jgi:hypothetical protein
MTHSVIVDDSNSIQGIINVTVVNLATGKSYTASAKYSTYQSDNPVKGKIDAIATATSEAASRLAKM